MQVTYYGHSAVGIESNGIHILIDPFIESNPQCKIKNSDVLADYILLTHGHSDHIADAFAIANNNNATIIATFEIAGYYEKLGLKTIAMNIGGSVTLPNCKVTMVQAFHSSSIETENGPIYAGMPAGFVLAFDSEVVYHMGDTSLFSDMKLIGELYNVTTAFAPIGDTFTMGPKEAAIASKFVGAKKVIPIHYDTFPPIKQDPAVFVDLLQKENIQGIVIQPGNTIVL